MTPYEIHVLLDISTLGDMERSCYRDAPIYAETLDQFKRVGFLEQMDPPVLSNRGRAYVYFLQKLPFPMECWSISGPLPQLSSDVFKAWEGEQ